MVEYLIKDPNKLYEICSYRDLEEYYPFSFIGNFNSIEVDIYYDVLNTMDSRTLCFFKTMGLPLHLKM